MTRWLPTILTVVLAIIGVESTAIQEAVATNPTIALVLGAVYAILKGILPSPVQPK